MKRLTLLISLFLVVGCASTPNPKPLFVSNGISTGVTELVNFPTLNKVTARGLGDTLVSKGYRTYVPAIKILEHVEVHEGAINFPRHYTKKGTTGRIQSHLRVVKTGEDIVCYRIGIDWDPHRNWSLKPFTNYFNPLCKDSSGNYKWISEYTAGEKNGGMRMSFKMFTNYIVTIPFKGKIEEYKEIDTSSDAFIQEFIYNGRVENAIKFVYRELSGDYMRPSFTQQIQYDLNQSEVIGFKNLRIKIINASNTEIEYVLVQNF